MLHALSTSDTLDRHQSMGPKHMRQQKISSYYLAVKVATFLLIPAVSLLTISFWTRVHPFAFLLSILHSLLLLPVVRFTSSISNRFALFSAAQVETAVEKRTLDKDVILLQVQVSQPRNQTILLHPHISLHLGSARPEGNGIPKFSEAYFTPWGTCSTRGKWCT